jgi:hypothetical protein
MHHIIIFLLEAELVNAVNGENIYFKVSCNRMMFFIIALVDSLIIFKVHIYNTRLENKMI